MGVEGAYAAKEFPALCSWAVIYQLCPQSSQIAPTLLRQFSENPGARKPLLFDDFPQTQLMVLFRKLGHFSRSAVCLSRGSEFRASEWFYLTPEGVL